MARGVQETVAGVDEPEHRGHDVFVSYARADREVVVALTEGLGSRGKRAWVDLEDIPPSAEWMAEIEEAIESADGYLVVVSPDLARSKVCSEEFEHARSAGKRIVPVQVRPTDPESVPEALSSLNWIDATNGLIDSALDRVVQALETDLEHVKTHTRLLVRTGEWEVSGDRSLLLRGQDLNQAEAWLATSGGKEPAPTAAQGGYVLASRKAAARRQRTTVSAVAIGLVLALVLAVVAVIQRGEAQDQRREADAQRVVAEEQAAVANSRALAAQALVHMDRDLDLAVLLSLEAYRTAPSEEAIDVLHIAAQRSSMIQRTLAGGDTDAAFGQKSRSVAAFSPDGELIASSDAGGGVVIRSAGSGDVVAGPIGGGPASVFAIAFSPSGEQLATGGDGGKVAQWDPRTGVEVADPVQVDDPISSLAFSPDGRVLAVGTREGMVTLLSAAEGTTLAGPTKFQGIGGLTGQFKTISGLAFSPDGEHLAVGVEQGVLFLAPADSLRVAKQLETKNAHALWSPEFSPDGRTLAAGVLNAKNGVDGSVLLWDVASLRLLQRLEGHTDQVFDVSYSSDGRVLASSGADDTVRLWDLTTGEQIGEPLLGHSNDVHALSFDPTGTDLVSAGADASVIVWDTASRLFGGGGPVNVVAFASDGEVMLSTEPFSYAEPLPPDPNFPGGGGDLLRWDTTTWTRMGAAISGEYVEGLAVGTDGTWLIGTTIDGRIVRWPADGGSTVGEPLMSVDDVLFGLVALSPDGHEIAVGGFDALHLLDPATGEALRGPLPGYGNLVYGIAFSPDGRFLATGDWEGRVRLWDTSTWSPVDDPLAEGLQQVYAVTFDPTGTLLAASGFDGSVIVWDTSTWERVRELTIDDATLSLAFSPDGKVLAVGTEAGEVHLIDILSGDRIGGPIPGQRDWVNSVAFSPDGGTVVAGSQDGSMSLIASTAWTDDVAAIAERLCDVAGRGMTEAEWDEFVDYKPYSSGCPRLSD
jgi:WD40 repeat protein